MGSSNIVRAQAALCRQTLLDGFGRWFDSQGLSPSSRGPPAIESFEAFQGDTDGDVSAGALLVSCESVFSDLLGA